MKGDGAYTDGGAKNSVESYYLAGHSRGRLARFVGATQLAGNDEQYAATLALVANSFDIPTRVVMGAELPEGGVVKGKDVHAWVEVQDNTGTWIPLLQNTFLPDRNQKPNQLQSKTDEQKIGALVPPPAGTNPPSVLQGPDQAQNAVNLKKPPKKLFDPSAWPTWLRWLVFYVIFPLLVLVGIYWLIRGAKAWQRRRHATRGTATVRVAWAWDDLMNSARSYGHTLPKRATRLEQAAVLGRVPTRTRWPPGRTRSSSDPARRTSTTPTPTGSRPTRRAATCGPTATSGAGCVPTSTPGRCSPAGRSPTRAAAPCPPSPP